MAEDKDKIPRDIQALVPNEDERPVLAALEREKEGYEHRIDVAKAGKSTEDTSDLNARIKYVEGEIARIKKSGITDRREAARVLVKREEERIESEREDKRRIEART